MKQIHGLVVELLSKGESGIAIPFSDVPHTVLPFWRKQSHIAQVCPALRCKRSRLKEEMGTYKQNLMVSVSPSALASDAWRPLNSDNCTAKSLIPSVTLQWFCFTDQITNHCVSVVFSFICLIIYWWEVLKHFSCSVASPYLNVFMPSDPSQLHCSSEAC